MVLQRARAGSARVYARETIGSMLSIDIDKLLAEIDPAAPCGPDLSYDPAFAELERDIEGVPERRMGDSVLEAVPPKWREIKAKALALSERTRDLRLASILARASLHTDGWVGFDRGLAFVEGLIERRWESVQPQLDPEDGNDPTIRVNAVAGLCGSETVLRELRLIPIVDAGPIGRYCYRDWLLTTGKLSAPEGTSVPSPSDIDAAFSAAELGTLLEWEKAISSVVDRVRGIERSLAERVGTSRAASFAGLIDTLREIRQPLAEALSKRGAAVAVEELGTSPPMGTAASKTSGPLATREDAVRMIEAVRDWFQRNEPSSPVAMLLERARRLVSKDFLEIVRDLAPDGLSQVERFRGSQDS